MYTATSFAERARLFSAVKRQARRAKANAKKLVLARHLKEEEKHAANVKDETSERSS